MGAIENRGKQTDQLRAGRRGHHCCVEQSVPRVRARADLHPADIALGVAARLEREFGAEFLSIVVERRQPKVAVKDIAPQPITGKPSFPGPWHVRSHANSARYVVELGWL